MHTATRDRWTGLLDRRDGLLVVTGPTGSGKTSTLYASLRHICSPEINIVTIEDPVEYEIPGATQIQVNQRTGLTFAEGLRSILRQDPDIILVGEIRDGETARIAVQAAMTGHLVLASMHTVDAPSAVARLVDLGVPPYLVAATLLGVVGQRLVRRSCPDCTGEALLSEDEKRDWKPWLERLAGRPQRSSGCKACAQRGYRGRIGVYELLVPTPAVRELVAEGASRHVLESAAVNASYAPMWLDGLDKVSHGLTSIYELSRHVAPPEPDNAKIIELPRPRSVAEIGHGRQS
jgi:type II secretory ATPase GspE/PulE/Tfp pilus assembly ATPase PilB-like protein